MQHQGNLQHFAQRLQEALRPIAPAPTPIQVQCALKQDSLIVLTQHLAKAPLQAQQVFKILETEIRCFVDEYLPDLPEQALIKLYLRAVGEKQPHDFYAFQRSAPDADPPAIAQVEREGAVESAPVEDAPSIPLSSPESPAPDAPLTPLPKLPEPISVTEWERGQSRGWVWLLAAGVSVAGFAGGMYVMTRPCVVGSACEVLDRAHQLTQNSTQQIRTDPSAQTLRQAQQQITEANRLLKSIPPWSSRHQEAETLLQTHQVQTTTLDQMVAAEEKANNTLQKSQTLPQPVNQWLDVRSLWQEAIAQLEAIPPSNPLHTLAQERLTVYRNHLGAINQRIVAEQQAEKNLTTAKNTARIAEARQGVAQSLESWQLARSTWQVVANTLQQIPDTTTSYAEAQKLLTTYQPKLTSTRDRATQEQIANKAYAQAIALAGQAKMLEQQNQWSNAVATWRRALAYARQVPEGSFYRNQSQPLVSSYASSLKLAEAKLQVATALQVTKGDLDRVCSGAPKICNYTLTVDEIRVQLTASYERSVRTALIMGQAGDPRTLGGTVNHLESLQSALQTITNNANIPMAVYNSDNDLIATFGPGG